MRPVLVHVFLVVTKMSDFGGRWRRGLAAGMLAALMTPAPAQAQQDGDRHLWLQGVAIVAPGGPWRVHLEAQPRWFEDVTAPFQVLVRSAVGRQVTPRVSLWAGYAWIGKPPGPGFAHEDRAWQQVLVSLPSPGPWQSSLRLRQEQRWQEGWSGASHRTRVFLRTSRPLGSTPWTGIVWNEAMVTWNGTGAGPVSGFDQNRLFGGVGRRVSSRVVIEGGYVWFALRQPSGSRSDSHVGLVTANLAF